MVGFSGSCMTAFMDDPKIRNNVKENHYLNPGWTPLYHELKWASALTRPFLGDTKKPLKSRKVLW